MAHKNDNSGADSVSDLMQCKLLHPVSILFCPYRNESVKWSDVAKSDNERSPQQSHDYELPFTQCVAYASHSVATKEAGIYEQIPQ